MKEKVYPAGNMPKCSVCGKEALFECSECLKAFYCTREHQFEHWKKGHKEECKAHRPLADTGLAKILDVRKSYYQNFSHKAFTECLLDAKVLSGYERKRLLIEPSMENQLDYGGTICLLVKTYLYLKDKKGAKFELEAYLSQKKEFLNELKDIPGVRQKEAIKEKYHQHLQKKLNLISCIANLSFAIGIECISYYVLYTKIILIFFGEDSYEASNCYFLVGCYYAEEGYFKKAIQCFSKATVIRGQYSGDCYYNIGVLYKMQGELQKALQFFQKALKFRQDQYSKGSHKAAQVNEMMGIIYAQLNDFKTALAEFDKALVTRKDQPKSPQYFNVLDLIQDLYDRLCQFIDSGLPMIKKPQIYTHLKSCIESERAYWNLEKHQLKLAEIKELPKDQPEALANDNKKVDPGKKVQKNISKFEFNLILTEQFTTSLNLVELFRLSQLQLQLQKCNTQFSVLYTIGTSLFYENLTPEKYNQLQIQNKKLFELIKLEDINKIKKLKND